jgi:NADP-dependent 3-hydroxy acid dehydrogenase YdfG
MSSRWTVAGVGIVTFEYSIQQTTNIISGKNMSEELKGKVAFVTGASSGIGEATARMLASEGVHVALVARREERLQQLAQEIGANGGRALPLVADVEDETQVRQAVKQAHQEFGRLDILVNNAGVMLLGPIAGADTEEWRRMVNLNVLGLMYCTHAALPLMQAQKSGHIVNISSVAGRTAREGVGVYNATKWAVGAFSESLRQEVSRDKIRVSIIEPGVVETELQMHISDEKMKQQMEEMTRSMMPLQSDDIARTILYAVSQPQHVNVNEILIRPLQQER